MYKVVDTRNGNVLGPFTETDARHMAKELNNFVTSGSSRGPFRVKSTTPNHRRPGRRRLVLETE